MRRGQRRWCVVVAPLLAAALAACRDTQSALTAHGPEAERVVTMSWVLFAGGAVIMIGVIVLTAVAMYGGAGWRARLSREAVVVFGGIVFPVVLLSVLLGYGLLATRAGGLEGRSDAIRISVIGEQWWWRVIYQGPEGAAFETANELRIPTGRTIELALTTADVIHSFWVPNLAGKVDMIPGRTNTLTLTAGRAGVSRGQCAEYCGGPHALMAFYVIVMEPSEYEAWAVGQAAPADAPAQGEEQGQLLFLSSGCGGCHTVRGTPAIGKVGPDLTHVGDRVSLAAGILPNTEEAIARWIVGNQHIKPDNLMPPFAIFGEAELAAIAGYLASLK